jgi:hypothetical protein
MSVESVKKRCLKNNPDMEPLFLNVGIAKHSKRFEKVVKANFNEHFTRMFFINTEEKNKYFEKEKTYFIHEYLEFLIDLYDYKRVVPFKKKETQPKEQ